MPRMDAFSAQIVEMVRKMPAEAILALVRNQLDAVTDGLALEPGARRRGRGPISLEARRGRGRPAARGAGRTRGRSADREALLEQVEQIVRAGQGMSASEVSREAGVPQTRVAAALKQLKLDGRIFQGGDRRFARYAGDQKLADHASVAARANAAGPVPAKKVARKRANRRAA